MESAYAIGGKVIKIFIYTHIYLYLQNVCVCVSHFSVLMPNNHTLKRVKWYSVSRG